MSSFNSYRKAPTRAFDFLYDPNFASEGGHIKKLQQKSSLKMSPVHLLPSYCNMFSDTRPRNYRFLQRNPLPLDRNACGPKFTHNIPLNKSHFIINDPYLPTFGPQFIFAKKIVCDEQKMQRNVKCQTVYRESECQTEMWEPEPKLSLHTKTVPEILYVKCSNEPGEREVRKIERDRIRREWEETLATISCDEISFKERSEQLRLFELEDHLLREAEFNENQEQRMEYVNDVINQRDQHNSRTILLRAERILRNSAVTKAVRCKELKARYARKLVAFAKTIGYVKDEKYEPQSHSTYMGTKMNVPLIPVDKTHQQRTDNRNLAAPKKVSRGKGISMRELKEYQEYLHSLNNRELNQLPKCLRERHISDCFEDSETERANDAYDRIYQHHVLLQKTIKGAAVQNKFLDEMAAHTDAIKKYRRMFPLTYVTEMLPEVDEQRDAVEVAEEDQMGEVPDASLQEDLQRCHMMDILEDIFDESCQLAQAERNKELFRLAREDRERRQKLMEIEEIQLKLRLARKEMVKEKVNQMYDEVVSELMNKIIPVAIEMITEKDARKFILEKAEMIAQNAFENDISSVEDLLNEALLPLIMAELSKNDEQLIALLGSYDAFESFMKNTFS